MALLAGRHRTSELRQVPAGTGTPDIYTGHISLFPFPPPFFVFSIFLSLFILFAHPWMWPSCRAVVGAGSQPCWLDTPCSTASNKGCVVHKGTIKGRRLNNKTGAS